MNDAREVFAEHLTQLAFDLSLYELLDDFDGVERAANVDTLQRVGLEDQSNALLLGDDEDHIRAELEVGEAEEHRHDESLLCRKHPGGASHEMDIGLLMIEWVGLNFGFEHQVRIACICEPENAAKL